MKTILSALIIAIFTIFPVLEATAANIISPDLQAVLATGSSAEIPVIVTLTTAETPVMLAKRLGPRQRGQLVRELKASSADGVKQIQQFLNQRTNTSARPLWLIGGMALTAAPDLLVELASHPRVQAITLDEEIQLPHLLATGATTLEWNIERTGAPTLWQQGYDGTGITIAILDSGVNIEHPDLAERWRGLPGDWFDPYNNSSTPYDFASYHGTGVASIVLGGNASGSTIGMAPGASLIAAKIFRDDGTANTSYIIEALQWVLNPGGDPERAPAVINNSWGFEEEAGQCLSTFSSGQSVRAAIQTIRQAGIFVVSAAGNTGPDAATSISPANYPESFSVGATGFHDVIADFSARGPSACAEDTTYPDLVAPGALLKVAASGNGENATYQNVAGTSFSAAHVAGAVALLYSAHKDLSAGVLEMALTQSATDLGPVGVDTSYGHGLLNVANALYLIDNGLLPEISANSPPSQPQIIAPAAGSVFKTTDTITLAWEEATDPDGNDITYSVVVADNPSLNNPLQVNSFAYSATLFGLGMLGLGATRRKKRISVLILLLVSLLWVNSCGGGGGGGSDDPPAPTTPIYDYSQTIGPLSAGTYYWQVVANDGRGGVSASTIASFRVE